MLFNHGNGSLSSKCNFSTTKCHYITNSAFSFQIHNLGLKFGIYEDYGNKTCEGYPGILGHMKEDAELFASWGVDYVKLDGCYSDIWQMEEGNVLINCNLVLVYKSLKNLLNFV